MGHFQNIDVNEQRTGVHGIEFSAVSNDSLVVTRGVTVAAFGADADAIYSTGDNRILFNHGDLFSGFRHALQMLGNNQTAINFGDLYGTGYGVYICIEDGQLSSSNARLDNSGAIFGGVGGVLIDSAFSVLDNNATGEISGFEYGVQMVGAQNAVYNAGRINGQGVGSFGLQMFDLPGSSESTGTQLVIENSGEISASRALEVFQDFDDQGVAVFHQGAAIEIGTNKDVEITNSGIIRHDRTAITTEIVRPDGGENGAGVFNFDSSEYLKNSGQIFGDVILSSESDSSLDVIENLAGGVISGSIRMLGTQSKLNTIANDGQIGGSEQSPSNGRLDFSEGQDRLTNTGTIALDGIYYRGGFDELVNSGTLVADIRASNALDVTNSGTVHSDIITLGTDENDLTNSGAITAGIRISGATKVINTGSLQTPVLEDVATFRNEGDVVVDRLGLTGARQFENLENFTGQVDLGTDATRAFIRNTGDMVRGENSGLISATFAPGAGPLEIINSGEMIGDVFFEGETEGLVTFQNTGSFQGALSFSGVGLALDQSGSWLGNIQLFNATNDTVNNTGSIVGLIRLGDGFNRLINHGQIIADGLTDFPISMGSDADVVENKGTITGNIDLGEGDNSFINDGVFNGDLSAGGGNDTIMTLGTMVGDIQAGGGNNELFVMGDFNGTVLIGEGSDVINTDIADLYVVDTGLGVDIVFASVDFSLLGTSGVEHLVLEGAAVRGTGNELDNDLEGNAQDNVLIGLSGDDTLYGKAGNDSLRGGVGKDSIDGNTGDDMVKAGRGDDTVTGGDGDDVIFGHVGDDELRGNDGADTILGGSGNDNIDGGEDDDSLVGNRGDDTILAGDGDDTLKGDKGNDELIGGTGDDLLFGDLGDDTAFFNLGDGNDTFDGGVQGASVIRDFDTLVVTDTNNDVPLVVIEADGTDAMMKANGLSGSVRTLEVETFDVTLGGGDDFVIINDTTSTDLIRVELNLGNGFNQLSGSDATVSIDAVAGGGRDSLVGGSGRDTLSGGNSRDTLIGGGDHDVLIGGNGLDSLSGGSGEDTLDGGAGNDTLDGGIGADQLFGGDNNDLLRGGGDDDFLNGASGVDTLTGGSGADRFDFIDIAAVDEITDFSGSDLIGLFTVAFPALFGGLGANNFVLGTAAADSDDFIIYDQTTGRLFYDEDGSGSGFAAIHFATLTNNAVLDHTDFMILN